MASVRLVATAPGKLMLLGEHAVLYGHHAMVCAVDQVLTVELRTRSDNKIIIDSELGHYESTVQELSADISFRFVLACIEQYRNKILSGFNLSITSQFSSLIGLGSSAAVTAATCAVISAWLGFSQQQESLFHTGLAAIRKVQSKGSGADLAASIYGGVLSYRADPLSIVKVPNLAPLTAVYAGYKTPTVHVIARVDALTAEFPEVISEIYRSIDRISLKAAAAWKQQDWNQVGKLMDINQGLMEALSVSDPTCSQIVYRLREIESIYGAKISGSGLGDCIVGLGEIKDHSLDWPVIPVKITKRGVYVE
ncbi:mevalonate kinase [candidate division KSB1 bacterium]|nr:mevalonate kinase [candidate division KSB1 bacterium]